MLDHELLFSHHRAQGLASWCPRYHYHTYLNVYFLNVLPFSFKHSQIEAAKPFKPCSAMFIAILFRLGALVLIQELSDCSNSTAEVGESLKKITLHSSEGRAHRTRAQWGMGPAANRLWATLRTLAQLWVKRPSGCFLSFSCPRTSSLPIRSLSL